MWCDCCCEAQTPPEVWIVRSCSAEVVAYSVVGEDVPVAIVPQHPHIVHQLLAALCTRMVVLHIYQRPVQEGVTQGGGEEMEKASANISNVNQEMTLTPHHTCIDPAAASPPPVPSSPYPPRLP
jgi:hypothetical protein